ncbi:hypothetical protein SAMN04490220_7381 [Rhodococcus jostii]|uniref:Uncharacterized protein n=1 Tax=Rhodococcus jostii TaxID=132919 RepID=A0A1H5HWV7_RHOJO|nr:hypothetical protein SAMN04490220_7381 [Rhodococcus jostii]
MSDVINTGVASFCHSQDHPGSVPVPVVGVSASVAPESAFGEFQLLLGSRKAIGARHRRVRGPNHHHLPARSTAALDQFSFSRSDRSIRGLTGHRRLGENAGLEVLDRNQLVTVDHTSRPDPGLVQVLAGGLLPNCSCLAFCKQVSLGLGFAFRSTTPGHLSLRLRQLRSAASSVPAVRQVELRVRGGRGGSNTPVHPDSTASIGNAFDLPPHYERRVPVSEVVPVDANTCRQRGQLTRPHHRNRHAFGQSQSPVHEAEAAGGVLDGWARCFPRLVARSAAALDGEGMVERLPVRPQHLLLGDLRPGAEPGVACSGFGKESRQLAERRLAAQLLLVNGLIPQEPAAIPLRNQRALRRCARAQPVGVTHDLPHARTLARGTDIYPQPCRPKHPTESFGSTPGDGR